MKLKQFSDENIIIRAFGTVAKNFAYVGGFKTKPGDRIKLGNCYRKICYATCTTLRQHITSGLETHRLQNDNIK